jgi:hypothetical protein
MEPCQGIRCSSSKLVMAAMCEYPQIAMPVSRMWLPTRDELQV